MSHLHLFQKIYLAANAPDDRDMQIYIGLTVAGCSLALLCVVGNE